MPVTKKGRNFFYDSKKETKNTPNTPPPDTADTDAARKPQKNCVLLSTNGGPATTSSKSKSVVNHNDHKQRKEEDEKRQDVSPPLFNAVTNNNINTNTQGASYGGDHTAHFLPDILPWYSSHLGGGGHSQHTNRQFLPAYNNYYFQQHQYQQQQYYVNSLYQQHQPMVPHPHYPQCPYKHERDEDKVADAVPRNVTHHANSDTQQGKGVIPEESQPVNPVQNVIGGCPLKGTMPTRPGRAATAATELPKKAGSGLLDRCVGVPVGETAAATVDRQAEAVNTAIVRQCPFSKDQVTPSHTSNIENGSCPAPENDSSMDADGMTVDSSIMSECPIVGPNIGLGTRPYAEEDYHRLRTLCPLLRSEDVDGADSGGSSVEERRKKLLGERVSTATAYELVASVKWTEFIRDLQRSNEEESHVAHGATQCPTTVPFTSAPHGISNNTCSAACATTKHTHAAVTPLTAGLLEDNKEEAPRAKDPRPPLQWHMMNDYEMTPTAFAPPTDCPASFTQQQPPNTDADEPVPFLPPAHKVDIDNALPVAQLQQPAVREHNGVDPLPHFVQLSPGTSLDRPPASYLSVSEHQALRSLHRHAPGEAQRLGQFGDDDAATLALVEDAMKEFQVSYKDASSAPTPVAVVGGGGSGSGGIGTKIDRADVKETASCCDLSAKAAAQQLVPYIAPTETEQPNAGNEKSHAEVVVASSTVIKNLFSAGLHPEKPIALSIKRVGSVAVLETVEAFARAEAAMTETNPISLREEALTAKALYHTVEAAFRGDSGPADQPMPMSPNRADLHQHQQPSSSGNELVPYGSNTAAASVLMGGPRVGGPEPPDNASSDYARYQHSFRWKVDRNVDMFVGSDIPLWSTPVAGQGGEPHSSSHMTLRVVDLDRAEEDFRHERANQASHSAFKQKSPLVSPLHGPSTQGLFGPQYQLALARKHRGDANHGGPQGVDLLSPGAALDAWFDSTLTSASTIALLAHRRGNVERYEFVSPAQVLERAGGLTQRPSPAAAALQFMGTTLRWIVQTAQEEGGTYLLVRRPKQTVIAPPLAPNEDDPEMMLYKVASPQGSPPREGHVVQLDQPRSVTSQSNAESEHNRRDDLERDVKNSTPHSSTQQQRTLAILSISVAQHTLLNETKSSNECPPSSVRDRSSSCEGSSFVSSHHPPSVMRDLKSAADTMALLHRSVKLLIGLIRTDCQVTVTGDEKSSPTSPSQQSPDKTSDSQTYTALCDAFALVPLALEKLHGVHRVAQRVIKHFNQHRAAPRKISASGEDGVADTESDQTDVFRHLSSLCGERCSEGTAPDSVESDSDAATVLRHSPVEWAILLLSSLSCSQAMHAFARNTSGSQSVCSGEVPSILPKVYLDAFGSLISFLERVLSSTSQRLLCQTESVPSAAKLCSALRNPDGGPLSSVLSTAPNERRSITWLIRAAAVLDIAVRRLRPHYLSLSNRPPADLSNTPSDVQHSTVYNQALQLSHELAGDMALIGVVRPFLYPQIRAALATTGSDTAGIFSDDNNPASLLPPAPLSQAATVVPTTIGQNSAVSTSVMRPQPLPTLVPNKVLLDAFGPAAAIDAEPFPSPKRQTVGPPAPNKADGKTINLLAERLAVQQNRIKEFERLTFRALASYTSAQQQNTTQKALMRHSASVMTSADAKKQVDRVGQHEKVTIDGDQKCKLVECRLMGKLATLHHVVGRFYMSGKLPMSDLRIKSAEKLDVEKEHAGTGGALNRQNAHQIVEKIATGKREDKNNKRMVSWADEFAVEEKFHWFGGNADGVSSDTVDLKLNYEGATVAHFPLEDIQDVDITATKEEDTDDEVLECRTEDEKDSEISQNDGHRLDRVSAERESLLVHRAHVAEWTARASDVGVGADMSLTMMRRATKAREALGRAATCLATHRGLWLECSSAFERESGPEPCGGIDHVERYHWWHRGLSVLMSSTAYCFAVYSSTNTSSTQMRTRGRKSIPQPTVGVAIIVPTRVHVGTHGSVCRDQAILSIMQVGDLQQQQAAKEAQSSGADDTRGSRPDLLMFEKEQVLWESILRMGTEHVEEQKEWTVTKCEAVNELQIYSYRYSSQVFFVLIALAYLTRLSATFQHTLAEAESAQSTAAAGSVKTYLHGKESTSGEASSATVVVLLSQLTQLVQSICLISPPCTDGSSANSMIRSTFLTRARLTAVAIFLRCVTAALRQGYYRPEEDGTTEQDLQVATANAASLQKRKAPSSKKKTAKTQNDDADRKAALKKQRRNCHLQWVASSWSAVMSCADNGSDDAKYGGVLVATPEVQSEFAESFLIFAATVLELDLFSTPPKAPHDGDDEKKKGNKKKTSNKEDTAVGDTHQHHHLPTVASIFDMAVVHFLKVFTTAGVCPEDDAPDAAVYSRRRLPFWRPMKRLITTVNRLFPDSAKNKRASSTTHQSDTVSNRSHPIAECKKNVTLASLTTDKTTGVPRDADELNVLLRQTAQQCCVPK